MADFGAELREARERKGISLRQIAAATKISVGALEALERNDISKLPGGIFSRAFVRSYATEIGLDPDETIRKFLAQFPSEAVVAPNAGVPAQDVRARATREAPLPETEEGEFESRQQMAGVVLRLILISMPIAGAILYFTLRGNSGAGAREPRADAPAQPQVSTSSATQASPTPVAATPSPAPLAPAADSGTSTGAPAVPAAAKTGTVAIEIAPTADCWIHLTIDGDVAVSRVVRAGEREKRDIAREGVLQVGDAAACAFFLNGRMARPLGEAGQVREIRITPANYSTFLP